MPHRPGGHDGSENEGGKAQDRRRRKTAAKRELIDTSTMDKEPNLERTLQQIHKSIAASVETSSRDGCARGVDGKSSPVLLAGLIASDLRLSSFQ